MVLLTLLQIQVGLLSWLSDLVGLLVILHGQVGSLAGLSNHLCLDRFASCISWQESASGGIPWWGSAVGYTS